jgi:tight adherence protein C
MMPGFLIIGAAVLAFLAVMLVIAGIASPRPADEVESRLVEYGGRPMTLEELELSQPFSQRILVPMVQASAQFAGRFTPERTLETTRRKLELAGSPNNWSPTEFLGIRGLAGLLLAALTFVLTMLASGTIAPLQRLLFLLAMGLLGFFLPVIWLGGRIRRRQDEIVKTLPDALDLLTISVEAGLPFDGAMQRVADKWDNELSRAFQRLLNELQVGKSRADALRDMAERMDVPDITSFVAALVQADQLGISIAKVLRIQSEQMRIKRRQRAEEKAQQAPIKMLIPMTFLIFPTILIIILGPAILVLKESAVFSVLG